MKISLIQTSTKWLDPDGNRAALEQIIDNNQGSDLYIFGEMFTTGFSTNPQESAESGQETLQWLRKIATARGVAVGGSISVEDNGYYFNRFYIVKSDGTDFHYDKRHLFSYAGEHKQYRAGDERVVVNINGVRILLLICYDLRFPVWSRNRGDYDMIVCVANWPESRRFAWDTLLVARSIENQCYVCGVNIVGNDPSHLYSGGTVAIDYLGKSISHVPNHEQGVATFELDMEALTQFRADFPALDDSDNFTINNVTHFGCNG